jgi:ABC-2 type transport system permease protein
MTTYAIRDSGTMLRRNLRHAQRYPTVLAFTVGMPIVFLLLFVYVFGDTLGTGLAGPSGGRGDYLNYIAPGIILITVCGAPTSTAISVAMDMSGGIINRFRTMAIARASVLTGHVLGNLIQTLAAVVVVTGVALALGFDTHASPLDWVAALGLLALVSFALIWLAVGMGLYAKGVETASNMPMPLLLLPFLGSGFVPTDSMPGALRWFAENQPFTPIMDTLRGLLTGTHIGNSAVWAVAWSVAIGLIGYVWSRRLYNRDPA